MYLALHWLCLKMNEKEVRINSFVCVWARMCVCMGKTDWEKVEWECKENSAVIYNQELNQTIAYKQTKP